MFVLASSNGTVQSLRSFWNRRIPIWEGHTRNALSHLVSDIATQTGDARELGVALIKFMSAIGSGFSNSTHGNNVLAEIESGCEKPRSKKPGNIQTLAKHILEDPSHIGVARAITQIDAFIHGKASGFTDTKIDMWREFREVRKLAASYCN